MTRVDALLPPQARVISSGWRFGVVADDNLYTFLDPREEARQVTSNQQDLVAVVGPHPDPGNRQATSGRRWATPWPRQPSRRRFATEEV